MSRRPSRDESLSPELAELLDPLCDRFEAAWLAGRRPRLEDFLAKVTEAHRPALLRELLALEREYGGRAGDRPTADEYRRRLPAYADVIEWAFGQTSASRGKAAPRTAAHVPDLSAGPDPAPALPGYEVLGELGRGGMGVVYRVRDSDLNRTLALKVLRPEYRHEAEMVRRFREEAQITAQLQHPTIPPIHEVGTLADGRPFLAMKLIRGLTLAQHLKDRPQPSHELPRFLGIFAQVCQALAYAHSQGVIHRDLKPSNIMVGAFGEVQVMDWGLAKVLHADRRSSAGVPVEETSAITTARAAAGMSSRTGAVLGTPAYMAPEQARGEIENLDETCDVFGLGAILCVLLTGQPPYTGPDFSAQTRQGTLSGAHARLDACGADAQLVGLARWCLEPDRSRRLRHAGEVASAVADYQAQVQEKLRQAEVERAQAQVKAGEERKRRRLSLALMGALLVLLLGVGGAAGWWFQHRAELEAEEAKQAAAEAERRAVQAVRQERIKGEIRSALNEAGQLQKRARQLSSNPVSWQANLEAARSAVKRAEVLLTGEPQLGGGTLVQEVRRVQAELAADEKDRVLVADVDEIQLKLSQFDRRYTGEDAFRDLENALRKWGLAPEGVPPERARSLLEQRPKAIQDQLAAILHFRLSRAPLRQKEQWLTTVLLADADPWRQQVRRASISRNQPLLDKLLNDAKVNRQSPVFLRMIAGDPLLEGKPARLEFLRRAQQAHPEDFWLNFLLAEALYSSVFPTQENRAARAEELPRVNAAIRHFSACVALRPENALVHTGLGLALKAQGDRAGASACYQKALALDPTAPWVHSNFGLVLYEKGDRAGAIACYQKALALDPDCPQAHNNLGLALYDMKELDGAIVHYRKALALKSNYAMAHNNLGLALSAKGDAEGAITHYRKALSCDPTLVLAHHNLGKLLHEKGDELGAIASFQKAVALDPKFAPSHDGLGVARAARKDRAGALASYRKSLQLDPNSALTHSHLGGLLAEQGDLKGAIASFEKALKLDPNYIEAYQRLGLALYQTKDVAGALAALRKAIELNPREASSHNILGAVLFREKDLPGGIACFRKAIALAPKRAVFHHNLGQALLQSNDLEEAMASYRKAVELDPNYSSAHMNLGVLLMDRGDLAGAIASYQKALKLNPRDEKAHYNLGQALQRKKDLEGALASYRKALELNPKYALAYHGLATILHEKGNLPEAIAHYRKALELTPDFALAHNHLGLALSAQKDLAAAIVSFRKALALNPRNAHTQHALSLALLQSGQFAEAQTAIKGTLKLLAADDPERLAVTQQLQECERLLKLDARLPATLKGDEPPKDAADQLHLADLCQRYKQHYAAAARFYQGAFAAGAAVTAQRSYNAARAAALAAAGQGEDAGKLDAEEKTRLRQEALGWLRDSLKHYVKQLADADAKTRQAVRQTLQHWQEDRDFDIVRGKKALAQLPEGERQAWQQLWAEVEALHKKAQKGAK
jgi:tetratricopeptide (TPR) repeat protein/serine/threonine protein kinase